MAAPIEKSQHGPADGAVFHPEPFSNHAPVAGQQYPVPRPGTKLIYGQEWAPVPRATIGSEWLTDEQLEIPQATVLDRRDRVAEHECGLHGVRGIVLRENAVERGGRQRLAGVGGWNGMFQRTKDVTRLSDAAKG